LTTTTASRFARSTASSPQRGPSRFPLRRRLAPYLFVAPFVALFASFSVYPMVYALGLSFTKWRGAGEPEWIGLDNYTYLLGNPAFWMSLGNSGVLWLLIIPIQLVIGIIAAVLLDNAKLGMRGFYRTAFIVPFVTPLVAVAQIWVVLFDTQYGAINGVLNVLGLPDVGWLTTSEWAKPTLALLFLWKTTGFIIIILLSGLQSIDSSVYEAASLDGAGRVRKLWSITIPLLRRTIMFAVVLQTLAVFQMFAEPYVVTQGGPYNSTVTAGFNLYNYITRGDLGTGAANSFLLVILVMALSLVFVRLLRAKD
jgi:ABC-type sugar transport system permease subunit